ncbi:hypothetical protein AA0115_g7247 [Alternaria tenuissima]|uniref:SET domain-containing protein n=1 Tax=Alternaria tenuissima TaxID=119927 RepID=A0AB37WFZ3_9PLEO|nr:hypothetical protein AA0115_g7247 [Alternaria tenuissima]
MATSSIPSAPAGNPYYTIRAIPNKGYGCFALSDLPRGTRILSDTPLLIVPVANYMLSDIEKAFAELTPDHRIHESVLPKERTRIEQQHAARTGKEASLISIFQTNCMEMNAGAAVFPHASRFNHSCNPNACFSFNPSTGRENIHVMNLISAGTEITLSYCDMMHDKPLRAYELKHYGFVCDCPACADDEDDEESFGTKSAERRFRLAELERETRFFRGAGLSQGSEQQEFVKKLLELAALHKAEGDYSARLAAVFLDIALICEIKGDMHMADVAATKALEVKRDCQGEDFPNYGRDADVVHRVKAKAALQR